MKMIKLFVAILLMVSSGVSLAAQTHDHSQMNKPKTESFKVWGNCEMCRDRIEKTVTSAGATNASWDQKTKLLTVTFDPLKNSIETLSKKLAAVGHTAYMVF